MNSAPPAIIKSRRGNFFVRYLLVISRSRRTVVRITVQSQEEPYTKKDNRTVRKTNVSLHSNRRGTVRERPLRTVALILSKWKDNFR